MRLLRLPGVFRPPSDAWLLVRAMRERGLACGARVLDVFTGSGVLAVAAAQAGAASVTAVDISRRAALCAAVNGPLNGTRVRALRGDLFEPVAGERFDLITANPPYVPGDGVPASGAARAWEGGETGRTLVDRLAAEAADHLTPGGTLLVVVSSLTGERETLAALRDGGLEPAVIERERGPLGPLVSARAEELERRGLLKPGEREEEMLVIAARSPDGGYARRALEAMRSDIATHRDHEPWSSYRFERFYLDEDAYPIALTAIARDSQGRLLGMRVPGRPPHADDAPPPEDWGSLLVANLMEALDTTNPSEREPDPDGVRWILTSI